jgi:uncharacterized protein (DUF1015 family)
LAKIKPFRALRPVAEKAEQVACVPYDVVDKAQLRAFVDENPLSFLRVTRPRYEFQRGERPSWDQVFNKAKTNLEWFVAEQILKFDEDEAVYVYRLSNDEHSQTGVVACCSLDEYEAGLIKKHENVKPDKVEERTGHILTLRAQTGLIFLAFVGAQEITTLIATTTEQDPIYNFVGPDAIRHTVWRVAGGASFVSAFSDVPSIYIADGHHRIEAARLAREALREQNPAHTGNEGYNYVMAGLFPAEELRILPYNRVVRDLNDLTADEFIERLRKSFSLTETVERVPTRHGDLNVYIDGRWLGIRFDVDEQQDTDPIERLDVSILQTQILGPMLGIKDARTD